MRGLMLLTTGEGDTEKDTVLPVPYEWPIHPGRKTLSQHPWCRECATDTRLVPNGKETSLRVFKKHALVTGLGAAEKARTVKLQISARSERTVPRKREKHALIWNTRRACENGRHTSAVDVSVDGKLLATADSRASNLNSQPGVAEGGPQVKRFGRSQAVSVASILRLASREEVSCFVRDFRANRDINKLTFLPRLPPIGTGSLVRHAGICKGTHKDGL